ncbi:MAG TPA: cytochrome c oxidase subunit 3 [Bryobacteraceae bacterium]|nr:cytochrome c oxidase subunit 3 [Bryobacteraceae bacterium]
MNGRPALDVSGLPPIAFKARPTLFWAAIGIVMIESTMFGLLIATYFYVRLSMDSWPPPGISFPGLVLPTVELGLLILSCIPAYFATEAAIRNDVRAVRRNLLLNISLAGIALVLRIIEWRSFNFDWTASAYGSVVWIILGLHTVDFVGAMLITLVLLAIIYAGRFGDKQRGGVDFDSLTWYFAVAIWVPLYVVVYLMPYALQSWRL